MTAVNRLTLGIVGCGSIGARHARNAKALGVEHLLIADKDFERARALASELGCMAEGIAYGTSTGRCYADGAGAVMVATPAHTHAVVAKELQTNGYRGPLFVEKPLAASVDECAVFTAWPNIIQVGYNWRFNQDVLAFIAAHPLDRLAWGYLRCDTDIRRWPGANYGAPLLECSHEIDLLYVVAPISVT